MTKTPAPADGARAVIVGGVDRLVADFAEPQPVGEEVERRRQHEEERGGRDEER